MSEKKVIEDLMVEKKALQTALDEQKTKMNEYAALGEPSSIVEALGKIEELRQILGGLKASDVTAMKEELSLYKELGSVEVVTEALERSFAILELYKELGTPQKIERALDEGTALLKEYKVLGSPQDINAVLEAHEEIVVTSECDKLASQFGISPKVPRKFFENLGDFALVKELLTETFGQGKVVTTKPSEKSTTKVDATKKPVEGLVKVGESKITGSMVTRLAGKLI